MCQQVKERLYCSDCDRNLGLREYVERCNRAARRGSDGDCNDGIKAHSGEPYTNKTQWCQPCEARYEQSMVDRDNHSYQSGGNYTW